MVGGIAYSGQGGATGIWVLQADAHRPISGFLALAISRYITQAMAQALTSILSHVVPPS